MTRRTLWSPRSTKPPDEGGPGRSLVVAGRQLKPQHPPLAAGGDPDRDEGCHRHDPPCFADLEVRRVEPEVREGGVGEWPAAEPLDLGVEGRADPANLALADAVDAHGASRIEQAREIRAVADAGHRQVDRAHPRVTAPLAIPVAVGQPPVGVALALGGPGELGHLGLHARLGEHRHALAQEVDIALGDRLADRVEHGHPDRPLWCPFVSSVADATTRG